VINVQQYHRSQQNESKIIERQRLLNGQQRQHLIGYNRYLIIVLKTDTMYNIVEARVYYDHVIFLSKVYKNAFVCCNCN